MIKTVKQPVAPSAEVKQNINRFSIKDRNTFIAVIAIFLVLPLIVYAALTITKLSSRAYTPTSVATGPTPTPTPTPTPPVNNPPIAFINNPVLPNGKVGKPYSAKIDAVDPNGDLVGITSIENLPPGIKMGPCRDSYSFSECTISGTPKKAGKYPIKVKVTDKGNNVVVTTFSLSIGL